MHFGVDGLSLQLNRPIIRGIDTAYAGVGI